MIVSLFALVFVSLLLRLGARKWAPRFDYHATQQAFVAMDSGAKLDAPLFERFLAHPIHQAIEVQCGTLTCVSGRIRTCTLLTL